MCINFLSQFHPVGHGLFYSCKIGNFTVVYDCGSAKGADTYGKAIKTSGIGNTIDLLIISHFHHDHINGIKALIEKHTVKKVVMPYISNQEKKFQLLCLKKDCSTSDEYESFSSIISKPRSFFGKNTQLTFLVAGKKGRNTDAPRDNQLKDADSPYWTEIPVSAPRGVKKQKNTVYYGHSASLVVKHWVFRFFINQPDPKKANQLIQVLKASKVRINNIATKFESVKKAYASIFRSAEQNSTSLICCHGPKFSPAKTNCKGKYHLHHHFEIDGLFDDGYCCLRYSYYLHPFGTHCKFLENPPLYTLLTGDAKINDEKAYKAHFFDVLNKVILFQIPHHGSKHNWEDWFIDAHPSCQSWVVSHNSNNKYRRGTFPSANFGNDISPISVTENLSTVFKGTIVICLKRII